MGDRELKLEENVAEKTSEEVKTPSLYKVFLLNDDYTTMEFVVQVLERVFRMAPPEAVRIMLNVHKKGIGLCGVYTRDIAETKIAKVHELARGAGFPLKCTMEKE